MHTEPDTNPHPDTHSDQCAHLFHAVTQEIGHALHSAGFTLHGNEQWVEIQRFSADFEQGILLQPDWQACLEVHVYIKSLYGTGATPLLLHEPACHLDRRFHSAYPLTQDHRRLAAGLAALLMESTVPFLDRFATCAQVLLHYPQLPPDIPLLGERLIYTSAFRERHQALFMEYNSRLIERTRAWIAELKADNPDLPEDALNGLAQPMADGMRERAIFSDDALFAAEIARQNQYKATYLQNLQTD
ncbi:hypothetical protein L1281_000079 [Neisseria sp. HSC-16F19]|nr:hypothetical protein [Neisseria sp. HSC-16F19]MCP2039514.1 hypothetical protein [Neisseria sp. HSC-16F19]